MNASSLALMLAILAYVIGVAYTLPYDSWAECLIARVSSEWIEYL